MTLYRLAMYLRQSRDTDGNELAVSRQREGCLKLCRERGWPEPTEYLDNNISASKRSVARPRYREMIKDIEAGLIDGIVVWDLDRLYRQPRELEDLIDLADDRDLLLATVTGDADLSTDNGRLFARIKGAVARGEGERKAVRWKASNIQGAQAGRYVCTYRIFGYTMEGEPLEPEAQYVRDAFQAVLDGESLRSLAIKFNAKHKVRTPDRYDKDGNVRLAGVAWGNRQIRKMLLNPKYAARRVVNTVEKKDGRTQKVRYEYEGKWTALVDGDTFDAVGALLRDPSRAICTTFEIAHQGASVYRCGKCGSPLKTSYNGRRVHGYGCKATPHLWRRGETLDDYVSNVVLERLALPDVQLALMNPTRVDLTRLQNERAGLVGRRRDLSQLLRDGLLAAEDVRRDAGVLTTRIAEIDAEIADATRTNAAAALVASGEDLRERWEQLLPAVRGQVIDDMALVTVLPCPRGLRGFDPDYVDIRFK